MPGFIEFFFVVFALFGTVFFYFFIVKRENDAFFMVCLLFIDFFKFFFTEMGTEFYRVFCLVFELCCIGFVLEFFSVSVRFGVFFDAMLVDFYRVLKSLSRIF